MTVFGTRLFAGPQFRTPHWTGPAVAVSPGGGDGKVIPFVLVRRDDDEEALLLLFLAEGSRSR